MNDFKDLHKLFGQQQQQQQQQPPLALAQQHQRPQDHSTITGANPASLSNLFSDPFPENDFRSFSDLLAGAIATQLPGSGELNLGLENWGGEKRDHGNGGFKHNRPGSLVVPPVTPMFNVSPGFSPSAFLNSPTFLSPLGITPQQTLAHLTAQAHLSIQSDHTQHMHHNNQPSSSIPSSATNTYHQPSIFNAVSSRVPPQSSNFPAAVDKPADDGYNWRKYGQKQVKGSEYPRSYYRCTTPNCPVKKKVERSFDGHITEIIYKGQHNHDRPQTGRRAKDGNSLLGGTGDWREYDNNTAQATSIQLNGPSDSEESGEISDNGDGDDDDHERKAKRRNVGGGQSEGGFTHRTMTEPKIVVQTRSDVDLLDDGYRWRKYGQKVVKGNPNPRSYYKCTTVGCKVRKHVERASTDPGAVITTYEGKHNHDVPATRGSINNTTTTANNNEAMSMKVHNSVAQMNFGNTNDYQPITLRLKEEQLIG